MSAPRDLARTVLLCLIGGSADAITFLRYETFVGAMTGNTVLLGINLVQGHPESALYHACIIAVFLLAVIGTRAVLLPRLPVAAPLVAGATLLATSDLIVSQWGAALGAAALGLQTGAVGRIGGVMVNTVFITGNLVRLGSAVPEANGADRYREVSLLATAWVAYAAGAIVGAAALHWFSYPMLIPAILTLAAALVETYVQRQERAAEQ